MEPRRIVVGVDFSDASLAAARWAAWDFAPDAEIVLVHVAPVPCVPSFARTGLRPPTRIASVIGPTVHGALRGLAELVGPHRTRVELVAGNPAEALATVAHQRGADAICVGRGSRRRGSARFGATTPQRLLARTNLPALIVPVGPAATPSHTVVGVDERSGGPYVLGVACRLAARFESSIDVLHVIEPEVEDFLALAGDSLDVAAWPSESFAPHAIGEHGTGGHSAWLRERARAWVATLIDEAGTSVNQIKPVVMFGDPGTEIIRQARERPADLVIVGRGGDATRASEPRSALPLGSTARLVMWAAPCPVLVLPPRRADSVTPWPPGRETTGAAART